MENPEPFSRQTVVPSWGNEPELIGTSFGLEEGETSAPVRTSRGYYIVKIEKDIDVDEADYLAQKDKLRSDLLRMKQSVVISRWFQSLRDHAKVKDYREQFF